MFSDEYCCALFRLKAAAWTLAEVMDRNLEGTAMWCIAADKLKDALEEAQALCPPMEEFPVAAWCDVLTFEDLVEMAKADPNHPDIT